MSANDGRFRFARDPRRALVWIGIAVVLLMVLAGALQTLTLEPGRNYLLQIPAVGPNGLRPASVGDALPVAFRIILAVLIIALPAYIIVSLLSKSGRKRLLVHALLIVGLFWLVENLRQNGAMPEIERTVVDGLQRPDAEAVSDAVPVPVFDAAPAEWLVWVVAAAVAVLLVALTLGAVWLIARRRPAEDTTTDALSATAQDALDRLQAGGAFADTIQRCYFEMCDVVARERNVVRKEALTPSEFVAALRAVGLPRQPVERLTGLFESTRYGNHTPDAAAMAQATECLTQIAAESRAGKRPKGLSPA
jgi:Domain of unknown function (DUF4129)